ncbi:alpha/beta-hydrolase [Lophium mytilinum]|uniref:Alpha/beta-hydrolase n=1 Tax=Lophium mytilinum TaxID=390894 RepID=A0A6A6QT85_9PEZI|nr:alpha/beta-hydrolase [Lophium mytilinum]
MTSIKKAYADSSIGQIHYLYALAPKNVEKKSHPMVLLHMSASSAFSMASLMKVYAPHGYDCYAPDMPGFGSSDDPLEKPPNIAWYANLYAALFETLGIAKVGVHLVGHHSGGVIGIEIANLHPTIISSLCLIGPAIMSASERAELRKSFFEPFNKPVADGSHLLKTWHYVADEGIPTTELELLQRETLDHIRAWKGRSQIYDCVWEQDSQKLVKIVGCPMIAVLARDDILWSYIGHLKDIRPDVKICECPGANFEPDRGTEAIVEHLSEFLTTVEA